MTGTTKLSVEKALDKIREDMQKSETTRMDEEIAKLDESIKRMRAQRLRLERARATHLPGSANRQPRGQASSLGYSVARAERRVQREHLSVRNNHFRVVTPTCLPHCGG